VAAQEGSCLRRILSFGPGYRLHRQNDLSHLGVEQPRTTAPLEAGEGLVHPAYRGSLTQDAPDRLPCPLP
jgi:hypothetical protein